MDGSKDKEHEYTRPEEIEMASGKGKDLVYDTLQLDNQKGTNGAALRAGMTSQPTVSKKVFVLVAVGLLVFSIAASLASGLLVYTLLKDDRPADDKVNASIPVCSFEVGI